MDDAFGHWLAGFLDGEGCFCVARTCGGRSRICSLNVAVRSDDRAILEEIQRETGIGKVYDSPGRGTTKPYSRWIVQTQPECAALVEILDRYPLRAKKALDYMLWKEAVAIWCANRNKHSTERYPAMDSIKAQMQAQREYIA